MEKASQLLDSGYSGVGQYILIPYRGGKKEAGQTKVLKDTVKIDRGDRIETVYLNTGKGFLAKVRRMQEREWRMEENGEEHERETYWAFKVGDNNTFLNLRGNLDMLLRYGENLNFTDSQAKNYVHLVKVEYKDGEHAIKQLPYNPNNPADPSNYLGPYKKKRARKWSSKRGK